MRPFLYAKATEAAAAVAAASVGTAPTHVSAPVQFLAGGTTLIDLMKLDVMRPEALVDISSIESDEMRAVRVSSEGLRLGALARMADVATHEVVRSTFPVIAESLQKAASAQLRNMASIGGNLLQRTRCSYFRDVSWSCNKREPGSGCSALQGVNRLHAVLGTSDLCIASYPGDLAQALTALDAVVETLGPSGRRRIPIEDLHREPGDTPHVETVLEPAELVTAILVPQGSHTRRSTYLKVRDRESYAFALTSAAVALDLDDAGEVREARIALGGVATKPWRARDAERLLRGRTLDEAALREAGETALAGAKPYQHNAFKISLGKQTVVRALTAARDMEIRG